MKNYFKKIDVASTQQFEIIDITKRVSEILSESGIRDGVATITSPHTTTALRINHFEPMLLQDILRALYRLVPMDISYNHDLFELRNTVATNERSNGHAHVKAFLLGSSEQVIVNEGALTLGERQSLLFVELDGGRKRTVYINIQGE